VVLQVAEGVDLVVDAATVAGLVTWEADSIGQEQPFSPILPVAVLLVRTKSQGESGHEQSVNERQKDVEGGGTDRGEDEVGSTVKPSKDWRRPVLGDSQERRLMPPASRILARPEPRRPRRQTAIFGKEKHGHINNIVIQDMITESIFRTWAPVISPLPDF
jgi:hypothetical protein